MVSAPRDISNREYKIFYKTTLPLISAFGSHTLSPKNR